MLKRLCLAILMAAVMQCANRDGDPISRINPYDAGGSDWRYNRSPSITTRLDSLWHDFDHTDSTGTIRILLQGTDLDGKYDSLRYKVFAGTARNQLDSIYNGADSSILLPRIKRNTVFYCSLIVADSKDSLSYSVDSLRTPNGVPPAPPAQSEPALSSTYLQIRWQSVSGATDYRVYRADSISGPYTLAGGPDTRPTGSGDSYYLTKKDYPSDYALRHYIVASVNQFGECRSRDTVSARKYDTYMNTPSWESVSQGSYTSYIRLSWYCSYSSSAVDHYEIYRASTTNGPYRLIAKVPAQSSYSYSYCSYNDTVRDNATYYYKIAAADRQGRGSNLSSSYSGYRSRLAAPYNVYASDGTIATHIRITWSSVSSAFGYTVYRAASGSSDFVKIGTTKNTWYHDTVSTSDNFAYVIAAYDFANFEGTKSSQDVGYRARLSAPNLLGASNGLYADCIRTLWTSVTGAQGYIIYRSLSSSASYLPIDTISDTVYFDSVPTTSLYYYQVSAYNQLGAGTRSSYLSGKVLTSPAVTVIPAAAYLNISWIYSPNVTWHIIHRSTDSTTFTRIDSVKINSYADSVPDFKTYYYRLSIRSTAGVESAPGPISSGRRSIDPPATLVAEDRLNGVKLSWPAVVGATGYYVYRSTSSGMYNSIAVDTTSDTFAIDSLTLTNRYYYAVSAFNQFGKSINSRIVEGGRATPPNTPYNLTAQGTSSCVSLSWTKSGTGSNPAGYYIYRYDSLTAATPSRIDTATTTYFCDSVADGKVRYYRVASFNEAGTSTRSLHASGRRIGPPTPTGFTSSGTSYASKVILKWRPSLTATGYRIYRSALSGTANSDTLATTTDTTYTDTSGIPGKTYYYKIGAFNAIAEEAPTSTASAARLAPPDTLNVSSTIDYVRVSWALPGYAVRMYYIYRSGNPSGTFTKIDSVTTTSYSDYVSPHYQNYYKVSAAGIDESKLSTASAGIRRQLPQVPGSLSASQGTITDAVSVSWSTAAGATGYKLYRTTDSAFSANIVLRATLTGTSFRDTVPSDSLYFYKVKSYNSAGESSLSARISGFRFPAAPPLPPLNLSATDTISAYINLSWSRPSGNAPANDFIIFRAESDTGAFALVDSTTSLYYNDFVPLSFPTRYWYTVKSYNGRGMSIATPAVTGSRK